MRCQTNNCSRNLGPGNFSGYCHGCYMRTKQAEYRKKRKKEKRCLDCGKKVNRVISYPDGINGIRITKFPIRCYDCRIKQQVFKVKK